MAMSDTNMNTYMVTVKAEAGSEMAMQEVTVMVTDVDEAGTVTLSMPHPVVDTELTATLSDLDGMVSGEMWQWQKSMDMSSWMDITGATMMSYTPVAADDGYYLRATVTYTDGHGSGKMKASDATTGPVTTVADQPGMVSLSSMAPVVGTAVTATLSDPDGMISGTTWQWSKSMTMDGTYADIDMATSMSYTPMTADVGYYLRATVMYTDGHGSNKEAMATTTSMVTEVPVVDPLVAKYDTDPQDGMIDRSEVLRAVNDYLFGEGDDAISRAEVLTLINLYLFPNG
jgi:hypothetical protein